MLLYPHLRLSMSPQTPDSLFPTSSYASRKQLNLDQCPYIPQKFGILGISAPVSLPHSKTCPSYEVISGSSPGAAQTLYPQGALCPQGVLCPQGALCLGRTSVVSLLLLLRITQELLCSLNPDFQFSLI